LLVVGVGIVSSGCIAPPELDSGPNLQALFDDQRFVANYFAGPGESVFNPSTQMLDYAAGTVRRLGGTYGAVPGLVRALNDGAHLGLRYDPDVTRTAAETFAQRAGDCLSFAILAASLADVMGLHVEFQRVATPDVPTEADDGAALLRMVGHVNLKLAERSASRYLAWRTVDFLVPAGKQAPVGVPISRARVIAMFANNRAVASLLNGDIGRTYWWLRDAIERDPNYVSSYITLGVLWRKVGDDRRAQSAFARAIAIDPKNVNARVNMELLKTAFPQVSSHGNSATFASSRTFLG
jgi:hypothetical protein